MRKLIAATTLTLLALAPAIGGACEYMDDAKADASPSTLLGAAQPEASRIPISALTKTQTPVKKQVASKPKTAASPAQISKPHPSALTLSAHATSTSQPGDAMGQSMGFTSRTHELQAGCRGGDNKNAATSRGYCTPVHRRDHSMMRRNLR